MKKAYIAKKSTFWETPIAEVDVKDETEKFYIISGTTHRRAKNDNYEKFFTTFEGAVDYVDSIHVNEISRLKRCLAESEENYNKFKLKYKP